MFTTDLSLKMDPSYEKFPSASLTIRMRLCDAFAKAWFKLTHRDMGPLAVSWPARSEKSPLLWCRIRSPQWIMN